MINYVGALVCSLGSLELKPMLQYLPGFQPSCLPMVTGRYLFLLQFVVPAFYLASVAVLWLYAFLIACPEQFQVNWVLVLLP